MIRNQISQCQICYVDSVCIYNQWYVGTTKKLPSIAATIVEYLLTGYFVSMFYAWNFVFFYIMCF